MHLHVTSSRPRDRAPQELRAPTRARRWATAVARFAAALALLATGALHIQQYAVADYRVIPTIGTLFLLNFISATVLGLYLLVPAPASPGRVRHWVDTLVALGGLGVAVTSLIALFVSEQTPLFGFMEHGYRLEIVVAIVSEAAATVALTAFLLLSHRASGRPRRLRAVNSAPAGIAPAGSPTKP